MGHRDERGFTLVETMVVIAIVAVLAAVALPYFSVWSSSARYKEAAWDISSQLRFSKEMAVSNNLECRVELNVSGKRYRVTQGNLPYNSTTWTEIKPWTSLDTGVGWGTGTGCTGTADLNVDFKPNGTADAATVCVKDSGGATRFTITTSATSGRVLTN